MANLDASAVTINSSYFFGGLAGKRAVMRNVTLALTGQGGASNLIPASALGLTKIEGCTNGHGPGGPGLYLAAPSSDGANLHFMNVNDATDATRYSPADVTGENVTLTVWGPGAPQS